VRPYDLLVFDWDGTLVDSISSIVACTQQALDDVGVVAVADSAIRRTIGLGIREMIDELVPDCDDALFDRICAAYRSHWFAGFGMRSELFTGVVELLAELSASGYLLGLATAKSRQGLELDLERTGLSGCFDGSRTVDEAPPKPHPGMIEGLIEELGTTAGRTLMIGDTAHDLETAANAGAAAVGVLGGSHGRDQLERGPHLEILDHVLDLPAWLAARGGDPPAEAT
jgi:phosphoglycolate phosphatase